MELISIILSVLVILLLYSSINLLRKVENLEDIIEKYDDPSNRRRSLLKLTPKGVSLVNQIKELLYGSDQHMGSST